MKNAKGVIKEINLLLNQGWSTQDAALFLEDLGICVVENKAAFSDYRTNKAGNYKNSPILVCADKKLKF